MSNEHILVLGATGLSGIQFVLNVLTQPTPPKLTIYIRPGSSRKLPDQAKSRSDIIRIVEGELADTAAVKSALSPPSSTKLKKVTTVVSFLGAYISLKPLFTRDTSHPIAEAFQNTVIPAMKSCGVNRVLVLSTHTAFSYPEEKKSMSWIYWIASWPPYLLIPQGNAEMVYLAKAVMDDKAGDVETKLDWTVFRVPHLNEGNPNAEVAAGLLGPDFQGTTELSRGSLAKWVLAEIQEKKWIGKAVMVANK